ncbi:MAG TPA: alpha/beta hydrolase [Terracidiphilus sp.]|jgi:pimeloyl-ACP methyl ester carboxylesterase
MSGTYQSNGVTLNYRDAGSGVPVVFLHPTPLDHDYWRMLIAILSEGGPSTLRAIVPDLQGHGKSELSNSLPKGGFALVPDAPVLNMYQLALDVLALLDFLSVKEAVFAGCSIGGYVMLELWRQASHRMRGLAFVCSKPQPDGEPALAKRAANIAIARQSGVSALFDGMSQSLIGATARQVHPAIVPELRARMTLTTEAFVAVQAGLAVRLDSISTVSTMDAPVLAIAGGEDTAVSTSDMEAFKLAPGGCDFHQLPHAGHFAAYEQPRTIASLMTPWLHRFYK